MTNILSKTQEFVEKMNETNSVLDKKQVLLNYPEIKPILEATYNRFKQYYVTSSNLKKYKTLISTITYTDIYELLNELTTRKLTGHDAIGCVNRFIQDNVEYEDIIYRIIDKDLKCRVGDTIINDVYPNCIPVFDVALAQSNYIDVAHKIDVKEYYASHKLDGCRCIITIDNNREVKFFSREGKPFDTLNSLVDDVLSLQNLKSVVLDGEICIVDENGAEDFQGIMKLIKRKNFTIPNPKFKLFDVLSYDDFYRKYSAEPLSDRQEKAKHILKDYTGNKVELVEQIKVESVEHLATLINTAREKGWEGLILRKNCEYKGKRSNDLLKVKDMIDAEYKVVSIETGPFRIIENGVEVTIDTLTAVVINHKDNPVSVGSGFSLVERKLYFENPEKIVGKTITVRYFEETKNQQGKYSLRFPIFKFNHGDSREV